MNHRRIIATLRTSAALIVLGALLWSGLPSFAATSTATGSAQQPGVLVVGGTPAGVAASLAAARSGENVTLVSATGDLGGTLTGAMMDQWDLNLAPDGTSVQRGIFAEMYARLGDVFTPQTAANALSRMVAADPRITVRYDEVPSAVDTIASADGRRIANVTFASADARTPVTLVAPLVIDATDAADVAALAGAHYDVGRQDTGLDERTQAVTLMFEIADVDWEALARKYDSVRFGPGGIVDRRAWGYSNVVRDYRPLDRSVVVRDLNLGLVPDGSVTLNAIDITGVDGLDTAQLANARIAGEREAYHLVAFLAGRLPGFRRARVAAFARTIYVRETRHVAGLERLTTDDIWSGRIPSDSIGLASYPIDVHPVDPTDEPAFAAARHVYGIPFGTLVPRGLSNLVLAGPAISATHLAAGSARVIPTTIEEGEADGVASAVARGQGLDFEQLARRDSGFERVRRDLADAGVELNSPEPALLARAVNGSRRLAASRIPT